jgi:NTP pyrophosphatase (non-canonical NTP hydrolase)
MICRCCVCEKEIEYGQTFYKEELTDGYGNPTYRSRHEACSEPPNFPMNPRRTTRHTITKLGQAHQERVAILKEGAWTGDVPEFVALSKLFEALMIKIYINAVEKGFWEEDHGVHTDLAKQMLVITEVTEITEAVRAGNPMSEKIPEFTQAEEEAADAVIRLMDLAQGRGYRLMEAILAKMKYNRGRPRLHGKEA